MYDRPNMSRHSTTPSIPSVFRPHPSLNVSQSSSSRSQTSTSPARPHNLSELSQIATSGPHAAALIIHPTIPIERYLAGCESLTRQAQVYLSSGGRGLEEAFICLVKAAKLLVDVLPIQHPSFGKLNSEIRGKVRKDGQKALDELSKLKIRLVERFEKWVEENGEAWEKEQRESKERGAEQKEKGKAGKPLPSTFSMGQERQQPVVRSIPAAPSSSTSSSSGRSGGRERSNSTSSQSTIDYVRPDRGGFDVRDILGFGGKARASPSPSNVSMDRSRGAEPRRSPFTSNPLEPFHKPHGRQSSQSGQWGMAGPEGVFYPTLKPARSVRMDTHQVAQGFAPRSEKTFKYFQIASDDIGSRESHMASSSSQSRLRESTWGKPATASSQRGPTFPVPQYQQPSHASLSHAVAMPKPSPASLATSLGRTSLQDDKPSSKHIETDAFSLFGTTMSKASQLSIRGATTEGGEPLRTLVIPSSLVSRFVALTDQNTRANLETCSLLMGTITDNLLVISDLLVPKQTATSDSCDTLDEAEIWAFQESKGLITVGWCHTHPSQSCFMSSLDLHTHSAYQAMLPEAIAIVCAPNDQPSFGVFRLTSPFGLQTILHCKRPGLFHPHVTESGQTIQAIYTDAVEGHIIMADLPLAITDLRPRG